MKQAHIFVQGFVQGVGFRQFVRHNAEKLQVTGWVKNLSDNRVEGVFQGEDEKVQKLIELCNRGPFLSEVKDLVVEWEEGEERYSEFTIVRL